MAPLVPMQDQDPAEVGALLAEAGIELGLSHGGLAKMLGVSRRSVSRWVAEGTRLGRDQIAELAHAVHRGNPSLATRIAALSHDTLVTLEIVPPAPPVQPSPDVIDAILCVAADAADVSPRVMRPALVAALRRAQAAGLTLDALLARMAPAAKATEAAAPQT